LEEQALGPIANPIEMRNTHQATIKSLNVVAGYKRSFKEAKVEGLIAKKS
jgi:cytochrome c peroxidase